MYSNLNFVILIQPYYPIIWVYGEFIKKVENDNLKLFCTNCGSSFDAADAPRVTNGKLGKEYVCPICEFYPILAKEGKDQDPTMLSDFEKAIRQLLIEARAGGLPDHDIIAVLKGELEFTAELSLTGHAFLVQLIDLGSHDNSNGYVPVPTSRDSQQSQQNEGINTWFSFRDI